MSDEMDLPEDEAPARRAGRPPTARLREPVREPAREAARNDEPEGVRMTRKRRRVDDKFFIDKRIIPHGVDYNWKRESVYGQPDPDHMNNLKENGWTPVPKERHPNLVVQKDGQILMERPMYLTKEAEEEDFRWADDQVRGVHRRIADTPDGTMTRNHPSVDRIRKVKTSFETSVQGPKMIPIPE